MDIENIRHYVIGATQVIGGLYVATMVLAPLARIYQGIREHRRGLSIGIEKKVEK